MMDLAHTIAGQSYRSVDAADPAGGADALSALPANLFMCPALLRRSDGGRSIPRNHAARAKMGWSCNATPGHDKPFSRPRLVDRLGKWFRAVTFSSFDHPEAPAVPSEQFEQQPARGLIDWFISIPVLLQRVRRSSAASVVVRGRLSGRFVRCAGRFVHVSTSFQRVDQSTGEGGCLTNEFPAAEKRVPSW